ncbi:NADH-quinone oxidoreductase subunit NuoE [Martelella sp. AD-3]|uniref:NADH-quinone oxidoreductase subunit NuoE n=1 Tax=Martelella sp. AD-3 TaxID=686597 RepID=UPI0004651803|nr:NADH-quinone oxidoreductase subunit NuoE [Martelella sp. AD-3]AMM83998.1 NADH-quinone oxidoreductase subunit E [Martelella sp. AD-3]MAM09686.1 NADH-quinone oxidoreductase subunit NuoE [Rhizobiaceae bacterium]|tara:strand:- start:582 stop:1544 length:963 start_codon:yes stop_codon:yes gene_type:complete
MSVRRLADENVQPAAFAFSDENARWAEATIKKYPEGRQQSAVIPLLMRAQEQEGWVTRAAIEKVADMLSMPLIRVLEVATFYTQFQLKPVGTRAHIQVCGTTPCMLRGAGDLINVCKKKIGPEALEPNADGTLSWEEVECQGACANAPMVMIFKDAYEDLTPERLEEIIDAFEAGRGDEIKPGPQIDRWFSAPEGGFTSLTDDDDDDASADDETDEGAGSPEALDGAEGDRPPAADRKPEDPDDLKMISGVGPKIEKLLNDIGIYKFEQIAAWTPGECAWVNASLKLGGRLERDEWQRQAGVLAKGGIEEYEKVFGRTAR